MNLILAFSVVIILYLLLVWKAGKTYPIAYLFLFVYFLQYIFSPYLAYTEYQILEDQMPISQKQYFAYVLPALCFLFAGTILFARDIDIRGALRRIHPERATKYGYRLILIAYFLDFVSLIGFHYLDSIVSFTSYFKFLGAFCLLFSNSKMRFLIIGTIYLLLAVSVLRAGVFINFFIWSTFLFFFITLRYNFPYWLRAGFIVICLPILFVIQGVKHEYRKLTWKGKEEGSMELLTDLAQKESEASKEMEFSERGGVVSTVARLNQGWHIGLTLRHVPTKQPFADGQEMFNDVVASLLPRLIFPNKKEVNSQKKFNRYTGHTLTGRTSMSIGVLGDFYINYGREGSFVALFIFGALLSISLKYFIRRYVLPNPINIIWIPFLLSYLIRANNDFYIFFNCLLKGFLIFLAIDYVRYHVWGIPNLILRPRRRAVTRPVGS